MILLADANVLLDFGWVEDGLKHLAALGPLEVLENVRDEIKEDDILRSLEALEVTFIPLADEWEQDLREAKRGGLSLPDATCLVYARKAGRIVLTSERKLRERCQKEEIEVHGSLWIVTQLYEQGRCAPDLLCRWLDSWVEDGARLPSKELAILRQALKC